MIRHIYVFPREVIATVIRNQETISSLSWALISIYSSPPEQLITEDKIELMHRMNCGPILNLCFGDITKEQFERIKVATPKTLDQGLRLFDETDAHKILDFVKILNDEPIGTLVVHCDAGISRSGAIGLFITRLLGLDEKEFRKNNRYIHPNNFIYDVLTEVSGINKDYEKYWEKELRDENGRIKLIF